METGTARRRIRFQLWVEKTALEMADAVIAVSAETKRDIERLFDVPPERIPIIYNGIDLDEYRKVETTDALEALRDRSGEAVLLFVGRITRQKGIVHLVRAIQYFDKDFQMVLCAGAPDTPEIAAEMKSAVDQARAGRTDVIWIEEMVDKPSVIELYSHAAVFCCPSIYEPFGIINLEAMACETAVVATAVGGNQGSGGGWRNRFSRPLEQMTESPFEPIDPDNSRAIWRRGSIS